MEAPELTKELIAHSRIIAKGRRIRDLRRLIQDYGGKPSMWTKKSSPPVTVHRTELISAAEMAGECR